MSSLACNPRLGPGSDPQFYLTEALITTVKCFTVHARSSSLLTGWNFFLPKNGCCSNSVLHSLIRCQSMITSLCSIIMSALMNASIKRPRPYSQNISSLSHTNGPNKLECFHIPSLSSLVQYFKVRQEPKHSIPG